MLVFATPIYYYSVSGQFKTMLDRANPLFGTDYAFTKAYLLATAAENEACLLYTSDAADDLLCVDIGGCRIIKKKTK